MEIRNMMASCGRLVCTAILCAALSLSMVSVPSAWGSEGRTEEEEQNSLEGYEEEADSALDDIIDDVLANYPDLPPGVIGSEGVVTEEFKTMVAVGAVSSFAIVYGLTAIIVVVAILWLKGYRSMEQVKKEIPDFSWDN